MTEQSVDRDPASESSTQEPNWEPQFRVDLRTATAKAIRQTIKEFNVWAKTQPQHKLNIQSGWHVVTPQLAEQLLIRNGGNRNPHLGTIKRFARYMENNDWPRTGQPIIINDAGRGLEGQHRELACYFGMVSFPTFIVADGVDNNPRLFAYLDNGKTRTYADALQTSGINGVASLIASSVAVMHDYDNDAYTIKGKAVRHSSDVAPLTKNEVIDFAKDHTDIEDVCEAILSDSYKIGRALVHHHDVSAFVAFRQLELYGEERMEDFWDALSNPDCDNSAINTFREMLMRNQEQKRKGKEPLYGRGTALAYLVRCSNAFMMEETTFSTKFGTRDQFPRFVEPQQLAEAA